MVRRALIAASLLGASLGALADPPVYYVDGDNGSDSNSGTGCVNFSDPTTVCATAFKTIHGSIMNVPGAVEYVRASKLTYDYMALHDLTGTASLPITFVGTPGPRGAKPLVKQASSGQVGAIYMSCNLHYVTVDGFDAYNPPSINPNGSGIFVGSSSCPQTVDHIVIEYNSSIGNGGSGIQTEYGDYHQILYNLVGDNGYTITNASASGISNLANCALDTLPGYHVVVQGNVVYGQSAGLSIIPGPSDGNGYISDDQRHFQSGSSAACGSAPYLGAMRVTQNLFFGNQGKGAHVWASTNPILIDHNIDFLNCTTLNAPCSVNDGDMDELGATGHESSGAVFQSNIIYAPYYALNFAGLVPGTGTGVANCNIEFGAGGTKTLHHSDGSGTVTHTNYVATDPNLSAPSATPEGTDFRPTALTPALPPACDGL